MSMDRRRLDRPDDWVCGEIRHALERRLPIIPLLLSNTPIPPRDALPENIGNLSRIQAFELRDNRWENTLSTLFERLAELGLKRVSAEIIRYPKPMVSLRELTEPELQTAMETLPDWKVSVSEIPGSEPNKRTELSCVFEFASFQEKRTHGPRWAIAISSSGDRTIRTICRRGWKCNRYASSAICETCKFRKFCLTTINQGLMFCETYLQNGCPKWLFSDMPGSALKART
jgi:hypothetical protein